MSLLIPKIEICLKSCVGQSLVRCFERRLVLLAVPGIALSAFLSRPYSLTFKAIAHGWYLKGRERSG